MRSFLFIIIFFIGLSFAFPGVVIGQAVPPGTASPEYTAENPPPPITAGAPTRNLITDEPVDFIQTIFNVYKYAQWVAVALAAIMITLGGINIAVSGAIDRQAEGKDMIKSAIFGLVLLFGANLILRTINPALTNLTPPHVKSSVMSVRGCEEKDFALDSSGGRQLMSFDCAIDCDSSLYNELSAERKQEYTCIQFCKAGGVPSSSRQCVQRLPKCEAGKHPEQFPPECYEEQIGCSPALMQACQGELFYGETELNGAMLGEEIQAIDSRILAIEQECTGLSQRLSCELEKGITELRSQRYSMVAVQNGGVPPFPDCGGTGLLGGRCQDIIFTKDVTGKIKQGAQYVVFPFYPKNSGPGFAQCLTVFYEKNPDRKPDEQIKWEESERRGLLKCVADPFSYHVTAGGSTGGAGGASRSSGSVRFSSVSEPPREGCTNCAAVDATKIGLKPAGNAGAANAGCWLYSNKGVTSCQLNSTLLGKLYGLAGQFPGLRITEAWPPTARHSDSCHFDGTCVDITLTKGCNEVAAFTRRAVTLGLRVLNEYTACGGTDYDHAVGGGHLHVAL